MTSANDNRTTELLHKLLDERGLSYQTHYLRTSWYVGSKLYAAVDNLDGTLAVGYLTPEQAIAATLGSGTCRMSFVDEYETASGEEEYLCECSECGYRRWEPARDLPLFCSKCGKKVER